VRVAVAPHDAAGGAGGCRRAGKAQPRIHGARLRVDGGRNSLQRDRQGAARAEKAHLGGAGGALARRLRERLDHEVRSLSLSHLQRGGMPTIFDRVLATRMGVAAVRALAEGKSGVFTTLRNGKVLLAPLTDAAGKTRRVNATGRLVSSARAVGLSFGAP
jgi:6-phosphofructokinase 1